jgi:hypothetical protein
MALWQFTFRLVPKEAAQKNGRDTRAGFRTRHDLTHDWWKGSTVSVEAGRQAIVHRLGRTEDYTQRWGGRIWGNPESNCLRYSDPTDEYVDFLVDIDVRNPDVPLVEHICKVAVDLEAVILTRERQVLEPDAQMILEALKDSRESRIYCPRERLALIGGADSNHRNGAGKSTRVRVTASRHAAKTER